MKLIVDQPQRFAKMRAHTATHLLHTQIEKIIPWTKQAWSFVDEDISRFDFQTDRLLTLQEISTIEKNLNLIIYQSLAVSKQEMSYNDAIKLGAKAFFEDKYWDVVRVISVEAKPSVTSWHLLLSEKTPVEKFISIELCGGTHVDNTREIWCFKIIGQEAVASGVKRLTIITGPKVYEYLEEQEKIFLDLANKLEVKPKQLSEKLEKMLKEFQELKNQNTSLQTKIISSELNSLFADFNWNSDFDKIIKIWNENTLSSMNFKTVVDQARLLFKDKNIIIFNTDWNFAIFTTQWSSALEISKKLWIKWGGNVGFVQGRDEKIKALFT